MALPLMDFPLGKYHPRALLRVQLLQAVLHRKAPQRESPQLAFRQGVSLRRALRLRLLRPGEGLLD